MLHNIRRLSATAQTASGDTEPNTAGVGIVGNLKRETNRHNKMIRIDGGKFRSRAKDWAVFRPVYEPIAFWPEKSPDGIAPVRA